MKQENYLHITFEELGYLFPFYLMLDHELKVISCGMSMQKLLPEITFDKSFTHEWSIIRPRVIGFDDQVLEDISGILTVIQNSTKPNLRFKGQFEKIKRTNQFVFLGSPWFTTSDQLLENDLRIHDFAVHDSITDLLHILKNNEIANHELKEVVSKVNSQKLELEKANDQLRLFQSLINNSSDAIQVADETGTLFYINHVASERLGIPAGECHQYKISDFEPMFKDPQAWTNHLDQLKNTDFLTLDGENINQTTGQTFPVEVTVNYTNIGGKGYVIAHLRDVTERKSTESKIRLQEEKFRNIIANMNLGLLEVDNNDVVQFCNQSFVEMSGFTIEEIKGCKASEILLSPESHELISQKVQDRIIGKSDSFEVELVNKRGEKKWWLISGAPNYNDKGVIIGSIGIHLDITEQKRLEKELAESLTTSRDASKAKESFLANMSHEIRTPLNGIIGMIRELNKEELSRKQQNYLNSAQKASRHLLSIINNILDISKIEAGELQLSEEHFSIPEVLDDVQKILSTNARHKNLKLNISHDPKISHAHIGDPARIRQVLLNLTGNAIKFTETGGIKVQCLVRETTSIAQTISIYIQDSGIGMDKEFLEKAFSKFQQEDKSSSRKFGGTGLGLAITKELIDMMSGQIQITSEKGKGSEVEIILTLPLGEYSKIERYQATVDASSLRGKRILLVEDNEMNRLVAHNAMAPYQLNVTEAENGVIAIEQLKENEFDIILMDLQMPVMGGLEATGIIRKKMGITTPIIALTANAFKSEIDATVEVGMTSYVTKPFEEEDLVQAMLKVLDLPSTQIDKKSSNKADVRTEALYDLSKLVEMSRGNEEFVQKMLHLFIENIPISIQQMRHALSLKDMESIKQLAHKLKPTIDSIKINLITKDIRDLEKMAVSEVPEEELVQTINHVTSVLEEVVTAIKGNDIK